MFKAAFDSGDPDLLARVYAPDAVFVTADGTPVTGERLRAANAEFQGLGLPIEVDVRRVVEFGDDLALLIVDWAVRGETADGPVDVRATATDVARRGSDGCWRYVLDCPFGVTADS